MRGPVVRYRAFSLDGKREFSTYARSDLEALQRMQRQVGALERCEPCPRPDFASREELVDERRAPGT